jgi:hypothetical protein
MDGPWKLRAEPWIAIDGPRKGSLEAITLWASRNGLNPGLFLENNDQLRNLLSYLLSGPEVVHGIISTLTQNEQVDVLETSPRISSALSASKSKKTPTYKGRIFN